jgi:hypothetical protein
MFTRTLGRLLVSSLALLGIVGAQSALLERLPRQTIDGRTFRQYATVQRNDGTYRQMYLDEPSAETFARTDALPDGAVIVMETYYSPGVESTNFTKFRASGRWLYGSFSPQRPNWSNRADPSCQGCHQTATPAVTGTFTLPMLRRAVRSGSIALTVCDRGGRTPCDPQIYAR